MTGYDCTDTSVNSLAELPQGELAVRLMMQAGWNQLAKRDQARQGEIQESDSLEDLLQRIIARKQFLRKQHA